MARHQHAHDAKDREVVEPGIAPLLRRMQLLVAVRMGEMWPPQLARQLATIDQRLAATALEFDKVENVRDPVLARMKN